MPAVSMRGVTSSSTWISRSIMRASFAALWAIVGSPALTSEPSDARSLHALVAASDRHAAGVCRSLRDGVLAASGEVLRALIVRNGRDRRRRSDINSGFEQALTIVYRILFLLFAEARALVPLWHPIYRESYSLESLRDIAERAAPASGLWDALRAIARLAHAGCRAGDLRVTPFNGRLFAPARTPLAERRDLDDEAARRAVVGAVDAARCRSRRTRAHRLPRPRRRAARCGVRDVARLRAARRSGRDGHARVRIRSFARRPGRSTRRSRSPTIVVRRTLAPLVRDATPERDPAAARGRSGHGQRRVSGRRLPVSGGGVRGGARSHRRAATRATSATRTESPSGERSRSDACTAST